ncbi:MAG: rhomboid family intramembrane serine protease [Verrucomicrobiales bacterium]|nr:rhomboid family intramembrane serine protease [Verrucomicrobiales bacterium]
MGVYDRDYMQPDFRSGGSGSAKGPKSWSVVTWLIVINALLFVFRGGNEAELVDFGSLSWLQLQEGKIWTPITYMFLHGSFLHLGGNMLGLFFFGRNVLTLLGPRHFLTIYFVGGVFGGLLQVFLGMLFDWNIPLIGASAGVVAIIITLTSLIPEERVNLLLFFVIPVRMKMSTLALFLVGVDLAMFLADVLGIMNLGIGNLAHLGGAFFGWLYVKRGLSGSQGRGHSSHQAERWLHRFGGSRVVDAEVEQGSEKKGSWFKSSQAKPYHSKSVDEILEKISEHGMQSLTEEERRVLEKNSEELARMTKRADRG